MVALGLAVSNIMPMYAFAASDNVYENTLNQEGMKGNIARKDPSGADKAREKIKETQRKHKEAGDNFDNDSKKTEGYDSGKSAYQSAQAGAAANQAAYEAAASGVTASQEEAKGMWSNPGTPEAYAPDAPEVSNADAVRRNATSGDREIMNNTQNAKLPQYSLKKVTLDSDGNTVVGEEGLGDEDEDGGESLSALNRAILEKAVEEQQTNQTSNDAAKSYRVQTSNGESIVVTKNPCYQSTESRCLQNYSLSWTDSNGVYHPETVPLNSLEYLAGSTKVTADMIQQARRQEAFDRETENALNGSSSSKANLVETLTSATREMIANGANTRDALISSGLAFLTQLQTEDTIDQVREAGQGMQAIQKAKDNAVYSRTEDIQQKEGVISAKKNKRFTPVLIPAVPVVSSGKAVKVMLKTPSGTPNVSGEYTVYVTVKNQTNGKLETFKVVENTPFVVEKAEWTTKPGKRTVVVTYEFANSAVKENYSFTYKVGQLMTAILPSGKAVMNSITALAGNREVLNYNMMGQAVAGRVLDVKWDNGTCFMEMSDSKDSSSGQFPSVVVASDKIDQSQCGESLRGQYVSMGNVTAQQDANGEYLFVDNSDGDEVSIMTEEAYNRMEDENAAYTQAKGDKWDNTTLKVDDDGTIYEVLPGSLGTNYVNLNVGNGRKVNVAVSIDPETGKAAFTKADGSAYGERELIAKGINPEAISLGIDSNSKIYAYDSKTGAVLSNDRLDARDTSNLSRIVGSGSDAGLAAVNTDATLTNKSSLAASAGEGGRKIAGQVLSTFISAVTGAANAVYSMTGNIASLGSGTFASLSSASIGRDTALATKAQSDAEAEALKVCAAVPDRCDEAMALARSSD